MGNPFEDFVDFLQKYEWVYNFKLTNFFKDKVWENIPDEWTRCLLTLSNEELNHLPEGCFKESWPQTLKEFIQTAAALSMRSHHKGHSVKEIPSDLHLDQDLKKGMNPKKQHEVTKMAALVHSLAVETGSDVIVDVGSGLGYLGQTLYKWYGHRVIGIEGKQSHTSGADKRNSHSEGVTNITCELNNTADSMENFHGIITDILAKGKSKTCIEKDAASFSGSVCQRDLTLDKNMDDSRTILFRQRRVSPEINTVTKCHTEEFSVDAVLKKDRTVESSNDENNKNIFTDELTTADSTTHNIGSQNYCSHGNKETHMTNGSHDNNNKQQHQEDDKGAHDSKCLPNILMIGLHCCGDLTPTMLSYFSRQTYIKGLCCVSCCYHRMKFNDHHCRFDNFPMSDSLKTVLHSRKHFNLNLFAMRLAAQETRSRWKTQSEDEHEYHVRNVAYRGILELFSQQESCDSSKLFRKLTRRGDMTSFSTFIEAVINRTRIKDTDGLKEKLQKLYDQCEQYFKYIEPLTGLQVILQPVIEGLITLDRQMWIKEQGYNSTIIPVFDDNISPRHLALVAQKNKR